MSNSLWSLYFFPLAELDWTLHLNYQPALSLYSSIPEGDHSIADWPSYHEGGRLVQSHLGDVGDAVGEPDVRQRNLQLVEVSHGQLYVSRASRNVMLSLILLLSHKCFLS